MLLVTVALVLVGFIFLLIGLITEATAFIYVSIACSVVAGVLLLVFTRISRRPAAAAPGATAPGPPSPPPAAPEPPTAQMGVTGGAEAAPAEPPPPPPPPPPEPVGVSAGAGEEEGEFPIADYDELRVSEILPLLPDLDIDELEMVREREESGKNRSAVIGRIDELIEELEAEEEVAAAAQPAPVGSPEALPIEDYDELTPAEILPLLEELDDDELDMVAEYEEQNLNRAEILDAIDEMFEEEAVEEPVPMGAAPAPEVVAPVEVPPAKKVTSKKAPLKKVAAKKAPAKKAPGKKAPVKKIGAKKAPAKKVAVKKAVAPAKKVSVKKVPVKKVPVKKVTVKKVTVKKAPAKALKSVKKG